METINYSKAILIFIFSLFSFNVFCQNKLDLAAQVPLDPAYKVGQLDNGIKYIIRENAKGSKKANFYAILSVGSLQEEPNEYGMAHLIEHLNFATRTNNSRLTDYLNYFKQLGYLKKTDLFSSVYSGPTQCGMPTTVIDINAGTNFNQTIYDVVNVPTNSDGVIDTTICLFKELLFNKAINSQSFEKERKIILEEMKGKEKLVANQIPIDNHVLNRVPLYGDSLTMNGITTEEVTQFLSKWYRPEFLTILVVGDINASSVTNQITKIFSSIQKPKEELPLKKCKLISINEPLVYTMYNPQKKYASIELDYKLNNPEKYTLADLRINIVDEMIKTIFQNRLSKYLEGDSSVISMARAEFSNSYFNINSYCDYKVNIDLSSQNIKKAFDVVLTEILRASKYGFTGSEFERTRRMFEASNAAINVSKIEFPNEEYRTQCYYYILKDIVPVSMLFRKEFRENVLKNITLDEVNKRFKEYVSSSFPVVSVTQTENLERNSYYNNELKKAFVDISSRELEPYIDDYKQKILFTKELKSGRIMKKVKNDNFGTIEYVLSNGMHVVIKKTNFQKGVVQFLGKYNDSLSVRKDYLSTAIYGGIAINKMGAGEFSDTQIKQIIANKRVDVRSNLNPFEATIEGNFSPSDKETAFQLIHLYYSSPCWNESILLNTVKRFEEYEARKSPQRIFADSIYSHCQITLNPEISQNSLPVTLARLKEIRNKIYCDPSKFTFIFTGDINLIEFTPLIEKYLGSLAVVKNASSSNLILSNYSDYKKSSIKKNSRESLKIELPSDVSTAFVFVGTYSYIGKGDLTKYYATIAQEIFLKRINELIRGGYGATYTVNSIFKNFAEEDCRYLSVDFQTNLNSAKDMKSLVLDEMDKFLKGNINQQEFEVEKKILLKEASENLGSNFWWVSNILKQYYFYKNDVQSNCIKRIEDLNLSGLKNYLQKVYSEGNLLDIVMTTSSIK